MNSCVSKASMMLPSTVPCGHNSIADAMEGLRPDFNFVLLRRTGL
jgi:hypothetical protein